MRKGEINVTKSSLPSYEEYCEEIKDIWDSHWLTNMGIKHQNLQKQLEEYLDCPHVILHTNGHLALESAINVFDFPKESEIITTPFTFASTTHAIVRCGMKPVFCDINEKDYTIDVTKIEELITDKTVAILPVHVYGNICNVEEIDRIAKKYNLKVIYDAAHAFGEKYKGGSVANFGDITMFSFHATKVFNTIEGGALCFKDESLVEKIDDLKNFGIHGPESVKYVGGNAKMNEFQAAMGICNLRHIDEEIEKRKKIFNLYNELLSGIEGITIPAIQDTVNYNYAYYPVLFDNNKYDRDVIYEKLKQNNIIARKYFYPLTCDFNCYKKIVKTNDLNISRKVASNILTLPLYAGLQNKEIETICNLIK